MRGWYNAGHGQDCPPEPRCPMIDCPVCDGHGVYCATCDENLDKCACADGREEDTCGECTGTGKVPESYLY